MTGKKTKKPGKLSEDDRRIWDKIASTTEPLKNRRERFSEPPPSHQPEKLSSGVTKDTSLAHGKSDRTRVIPAPISRLDKPGTEDRSPPIPGVAPLDRRTRQRLARGNIPIDARIDLHGLTQAAAHGRLLHFLRSAQAQGDRMALVITGKGTRGYGEDGRFDSKPGVLHRAVPNWLQTPEFRVFVSGFDRAGRSHGGEGAIYVRLRRKQRGGWQ